MAKWPRTPDGQMATPGARPNGHGESEGDVWAEWLGRRRDGGSPARRLRTLDRLAPVRDQVLAAAAIAPGDVVVDVGCGDGMLGLAALAQVGEGGRVVFLDVSAALLDRCRAGAEELGLRHRAAFVQADAADLAPLGSSFADAVMTRSVLIYVADKARAFAEFRRVLRPGGRLSVWEPINAHGFPEPDERLAGYDVGQLATLAAKVREVFERRQPRATSPMLDFDERDLLRLAGEAGFTDLRLTLEIEDRAPEPVDDFDVFLDSSPNPLAPTLREAVEEALTPYEADDFLAHLRPLAEAGDGCYRSAVAHLVGRAA
jgi:ubiquinone/menaquinone biosynthesis C-methylase UbiE